MNTSKVQKAEQLEARHRVNNLNDAERAFDITAEMTEAEAFVRVSNGAISKDGAHLASFTADGNYASFTATTPDPALRSQAYAAMEEFIANLKAEEDNE